VLLALDEEVHLGAKGGARLGFVEVGEKRIVFAVVDAASVKTFGEDAGEGRFPDAQRAFNGDEAGRLWAALGNQRALGGRGVVARHRWKRPDGKGRCADYNRVALAWSREQVCFAMGCARLAALRNLAAQRAPSGANTAG